MQASMTMQKSWAFALTYGFWCWQSSYTRKHCPGLVSSKLFSRRPGTRKQTRTSKALRRKMHTKMLVLFKYLLLQETREHWSTGALEHLSAVSTALGGAVTTSSLQFVKLQFAVQQTPQTFPLHDLAKVVLLAGAVTVRQRHQIRQLDNTHLLL